MNAYWRVKVCGLILSGVAGLQLHAHAAATELQPSGQDDQPAIQAALDALPASGGTVILGSGVFVLSAPIEMPSDRPVTLRGQGDASVLVLDSGHVDRLRSRPMSDWDGVTVPGRHRPLLVLRGGPAIRIQDLAIGAAGTGILLAVDDPVVDYDRVDITGLRFEQVHTAIRTEGAVDVLIHHIAIRDCRVRHAHVGIALHNSRIARADLTGNTLQDLSFRGIMVGNNDAGEGFFRHNVTIADNVIRDIINETDAHVVGIQGYGVGFRVANNRIENVRTTGPRGQGIYVKVSYAHVVDNLLIDAGGRVGAIAFVGLRRESQRIRNPAHSSIIAGNIIRYENPSFPNPRGIDLRAQELLVSGNIVEGFTTGIVSRRGGHLTIVNNRLAHPASQAGPIAGITCYIATGAREIGEEQNWMVQGNELYAFHGGDQEVAGIVFRNHSAGGEVPPRMDQIVISGNLLTDFSSTTEAVGIRLTEESRGGGMARVRVRDNLIHEVPTAVVTDGPIEDMIIQGIDDE